MAGTITALKAQARSKDRINVYLDGEYAFGLALIHALWLRVGQHLTDAEITELQAADTLEKARQRALGLISYRPRSVSEVQHRLKRAGVDVETIDEVVTSLRAAGLLDDETFSKAWVESRLGATPRSKRMIAWELRQKGVSESSIDASLAGVDDEASAYQLALKRWPRIEKLTEVGDRKRKLGEYLARNGYGYDVIQEVITRLEREKQAGSAGDEDTDTEVGLG
ncbi:MAG: RecX family transcriptional regulator [Chloroflexi bacterium]|nr:RecX family transcriptional regulator [Chloroflexota bacterium]MCL5275798.1 RecX family transcriptional regulator [Chloroflexota bacterium]